MSNKTLRFIAAILIALFSNVAVADQQQLTFERDVRPILKEYCFDCHGAEKELKAGLDLRLMRLIANGGESGPALVVDKPDASLIIQKLREGEMPPKGKKPSAEKIAVIARWVAEGAKTLREEPESLAAGEIYFSEEERAFWSFQPIERPAIPKVDVHVRTPIDALIAANGGDGFAFAADADNRTMIRRLSLGLTGLPPTPEEIDAFLKDKSEQAYDTLIQQLLNSPHYGERWARHWLDVAGYADSEGANSQDSPRPWAWQYRDYVIKSLNADKPFDRFIVEQLAGDELVPLPHKNLPADQIALLAATGFLRMAADPTGSSPDNTDEGRNRVITDTIKIVSSSLLGLTVECAQCHDHRYDPIPQRDYYQLRAVFEPALNPKQWKAPSQRKVSLYTDADHAEAAEIEAKAIEVLKQRGLIERCYIEAALWDELPAIPEELRQAVWEACLTEKPEQTEEQNALLAKYPFADVNRGSLYQYDEKGNEDLKALAKQAEEIRATKPFHPYLRPLIENPGANPDTRLFHRGDYRQATGDALIPAALTIASQPSQRVEFPANDESRETTGRRLAYAKWLTSGEHPLVARVIVNRIWMHHFGRGLVGTPGDFGVLGERPANQQLLDFLAAEFMQNGWSLKHLHMLIVASTVYRQSSTSAADDYSTWRVQRLDAETIRDRSLAVSGQLDREMFGQPIPVKANDAGQFEIEVPRRSLYANTRRTEPVTMLQSFDAPVMETNCDRREVSNAATQALLVMNGDFHAATARKFAERVRQEAGAPVDAQIARAFELAYGREASEDEIFNGAAFFDLQNALQTDAKPEDAHLTALSMLCHALLSSNEFLYVD